MACGFSLATRARPGSFRPSAKARALSMEEKSCRRKDHQFHVLFYPRFLCEVCQDVFEIVFRELKKEENAERVRH